MLLNKQILLFFLGASAFAQAGTPITEPTPIEALTPGRYALVRAVSVDACPRFVTFTPADKRGAHLILGGFRFETVARAEVREDSVPEGCKSTYKPGREDSPTSAILTLKMTSTCPQQPKLNSSEAWKLTIQPTQLNLEMIDINEMGTLNSSCLYQLGSRKPQSEARPSKPVPTASPKQDLKRKEK